MRWRHALWAALLVPAMMFEHATHRLWGFARGVREVVWRKLTDCTCIRPGWSCNYGKHKNGPKELL
jgi:hypothetical protein